MTKALEGFRTSGNLTGDIVTKGRRTERNSHNFSHTPRNNQKRHATPGNRFPFVCGDFSMILVSQFM